MTRPAAVLLDLDGTLADSRPGIVAALNGTLRAHGLPERDEAELVARIGPPISETWAWLLDRDETEVADVVLEYRDRYATTMLDGTFAYPGVAGLLDALRAEGRPLVVATSKAQALAHALLLHLELAGRVAAVLGPVPPVEEDKAGTIARALAALAASGPADAPTPVMLGDRLHDVTGAAAHGLRCVGAGWGYGGEDELWAAGAAAIARTPAEVVGLLDAR